MWGTSSEDVEFSEAAGLDHLGLPGDADAAGAELPVEGVVGGVQVHALHRAELLDVEHVLRVHRMGLEQSIFMYCFLIPNTTKTKKIQKSETKETAQSLHYSEYFFKFQRFSLSLY